MKPQTKLTRRNYDLPTVSREKAEAAYKRFDAVNSYNDLLKAWGAEGKGLKKGWLGRSSSIFITHPKWAMRLLRGNVAEEGVAPKLKDLKQMGTTGAVAAATFGLIVKPYVWQRRRLIKKAINLFTQTGEEDNFKKLAMRTSRLLFENNANKNTTIFDRKLEGEIFEIFGKLAKQSVSFGKRHIHISKWSDIVVGKMFFREIVRNTLVMDYNLLLRIRDNPEKFEALRYALIGDSVQGPIEEGDSRRLRFAASVMQDEGPKIDQYIRQKGHRGDVIRQILAIRAKGRKFLDSQQEEERFYNRVLKTHAVEPIEVDAYAFNAYYQAKEVLAKTRNPSKGIDALQQIVKDVEAIYPKEIIENNVRWLRGRKSKPEKTRAAPKTTVPFIEGASITFRQNSTGMKFKPSRKRNAQRRREED